MTSEDLSTNKKSEEDNNREDELFALQKQSSELVGRIKQNNKESSEAIQNLDEYADQAIEDFKKDVEEFVSYGKRVITNSKKSIDKISKKAISSIDSALSYFRIFIIITISALVIIGVIGGYLFHFYLTTFESEFFSVWGVLSLITVISLWYLRNSLDKKGLTSEVLNEKEFLVGDANSKPNQIHDLSPLKRFAKAARNGIKGLTSNTLDLIPATSQLISHQNKKIKQQQFVKNFVFALKRYEIDVTEEAEQVMITTSWRYDDKESWLKDLSNQMHSIFKSLNPELFQLFYYEFFDEKYASILWTDIQESENLREQIATHIIHEEIIKTPEADNSVRVVSKLLEKMPQYSLEEIKNRGTNFFKNLGEFKKSCLNHLEFFGINICDKKELLMQFIPDSDDMNNWRDDVITFISLILSKDPVLVKLVIFSAEGDYEGSKIWTNILETNKNDETDETHLLDEIASLLTIKRIRPKFGDFNKKTFHEHLKLAMLKTQSFSLIDIETTLQEIEAEILRIKYRILRTLSEYKLQSFESEFFNAYVPSFNASIEAELKELVNNRLKTINKDLFSLLYSTANGLDDAQDLFQKFIRTSTMEEFGALLIKNSFVNESKFNVNIVLVLQTQVSFELGTFISIYSRYERLYESLDNFYPFLKKNGVLFRKQPLKFSEITKITPVSSVSNLEDQLERIASKLVCNSDSKDMTYMKSVTNIALAVTTIFLRIHGYSGYSNLCRKAAKKEFELASKIIFNYTKIVAEERLSGYKETLKMAIERASRKTGDFYNFEFFKTELADGKLEPNAVFLESRWKEEIRTEFKNLKNRGFETDTLKNYVDSIKTILKKEISRTVVKEFLITQVLSAYLLTVPGSVPGITFVRDKMHYIRQAEEELAKKNGDDTYRNLVRISPGGGKATRIGLVPLELDFDDFSSKFNQVWERAVKLHNETETNDPIQDPLPVYLIRIFPSDDGLKEIMPSLDIRTKPLETIRGLIQDTVNSEDSVSILSLIQNVPNGKLALVNVIRAIFDSPKSNLYMLIKEQYEKTGIKSKLLVAMFENKQIETGLFLQYHVKSISGLGLQIAERVSNDGEKKALEEFQQSLNDLVGKKMKINLLDVEVLTKTLFNNLNSIGLLATI